MQFRDKSSLQMQLRRIFNIDVHSRPISRTKNSLGNIPLPTSLADVERSVEVEVVALRGGTSDEEREWERRLVEFGIVENVRIQILHEGPLGKDPLVVMVDGMRIALRRRQASAIAVRCLVEEEI